MCLQRLQDPAQVAARRLGPVSVRRLRLYFGFAEELVRVRGPARHDQVVPGPRHGHVQKAALFFRPFPARRSDMRQHAGAAVRNPDPIKFQPLRAVHREDPDTARQASAARADLLFDAPPQLMGPDQDGRALAG